ncbi:MAG TPA: sigma-70 family RNA polymerase sigma factor [Thermomicrobiales bacterium]|nr:sigma-70 family RNA polymerase sigma factor [Thermomicrobiales bacterium]
MEGRPLDETVLIERARDGDVRAWEEIVLLYQDVVLRTAWLITGSQADAEDAAQEAFVNAWLAIRRFRRGSPFRPWILRIVANEARNRRRGAGRRDRLALRAEALLDPVGAAPSAEELALANQRRLDLLAAVDRLGDDERLIVACRYLLGLSEAETAEVAGCPRGTVKSRLSRALVRLRAELDAPAERSNEESHQEIEAARREQ